MTYELRFPLEYIATLGRHESLSGSGSTREISPSELRFRCRRDIPVNTHIQARVRLIEHAESDGAKVDLVVTGFVISCNGGMKTVRLNSRSFDRSIMHKPTTALE